MWWVKYRVKSSASKGDWQWRPLYMETASKREARAVAIMSIESIAEDHNWSEHYRGIDFKVFACAPEAVVHTFLEQARHNARWARECVVALNLELKRSRHASASKARKARARRARR